MNYRSLLRSAGFLGLTLASVASSGCKARKDTGSSQVKYGFLQGINTRNLIYLPDGGTVKICGSHYDDIAWAINVWAGSIGRHLTISSSCDSPHIKVFDKDDSYAISECKKYNLVGREFTQHTFQPMEVVDCGGLTKKLALHEAGHLFGLCDQYPGEIEKCAFTTAAVPGSVMHSATTDYLTADDIAGIKALAAAYGSQSGIILRSGTYDIPGGGFNLQVTAKDDGRRTTGISLVYKGQSWTYGCDEAGFCNNSPVSVKILGPTSFDYTWNGVYHLSLVTAAKLVDVADNDESAVTPSGSVPGPTGDQGTFDTVSGPLACDAGVDACAQQPSGKRACACSYYEACFGIESAELCTDLD